MSCCCLCFESGIELKYCVKPKRALAFHTANGLPSLGPTQQFVFLFAAFNPLLPKSLSQRVHPL